MNNDDQKTGVNPSIQSPIDPNNDMSDTMDTTGMTGITQNFNQNQTSTSQQQEDALPPTASTMSSAMVQRANEIASEDDAISSSSATTTFSTIPKQQLINDDASTPPSVFGEQSVSGDMPDPESDDDTLQNAQAMGFQVDEDPENPKPLNMAADFDRGEEEAHK